MDEEPDSLVEAEGAAYALFTPTKRFEQPKLELRFLGVRKQSLGYSFIDAYEIDGDTVVIEHTRYRATLKGRNLEPLYQAPRRERVGYIQQTDPMRDAAGDDATAVYEMTVEPLR
ncbi:hypothetical protein [Singulisphaera sp. PoT]|uniref:hypothetical protein n=1 Tax=Singulisphaera sp. PoT TaxID=3411797 RepID=UPI003BF50A47